MPNQHDQYDGYLMTAAAAKLMGVSRGTVIRWSNIGILPADWVTPGGARRYRLTTLERFMAENRGGRK